MYRLKSQPDAPKTAKCDECGSNRLMYGKGKVTCTNCGKTIGATFNKYGAKRTKAADGIVRDSKYEASIADSLLLRKNTGDILDYDTQFKLEMWAYDQNGNRAMKVSHKVDFRIHHRDGSFELLEAKGVETADYKMRRKWLETFWLPLNKDHIYTVIKQNSHKKY